MGKIFEKNACLFNLKLLYRGDSERRILSDRKRIVCFNVISWEASHRLRDHET